MTKNDAKIRLLEDFNNKVYDKIYDEVDELYYGYVSDTNTYQSASSINSICSQNSRQNYY